MTNFGDYISVKFRGLHNEKDWKVRGIKICLNSTESVRE
jgi:hypothetical protein